MYFKTAQEYFSFNLCFNHSRISSFGKALECRAGGCGFHSLCRINTQGLSITEKSRCRLCPANRSIDLHMAWMMVPSRSAVGDLKIVLSCFFFSFNFFVTS